MDKECLAFFKAKFPEQVESLRLSTINDTENYISFIIENPGIVSNYGHTCIRLKFSKRESLMSIELVKKCSLAGQDSINTAIEFAQLHNVEKVKLLDVSSIEYKLADGEPKEISLKESALLASGVTYYEKYFGFRNSFDQYRDVWIDLIQLPMDEIIHRIESSGPSKEIVQLINEIKGFMSSSELSKYVSDSSSIKNIFLSIRRYLEINCPKQKLNICVADVNFRDFKFIEDFISKTFRFVMAAMMIQSGLPVPSYNSIERFNKQFDYYEKPIPQLIPVGTLATIYNTTSELDGSIGMVRTRIPAQYEIQLFDGRLLTIPVNNAKITDVVELQGLQLEALNGQRGKIVDYNPVRNRYNIRIDSDASTRAVKPQNIRGLGGGTRRYKKHRKSKKR